MSDLIGWAIYAWATAAIAAGWALWQAVSRALRRAEARRAEKAARPIDLEQLWQLDPIETSNRNTTRKEEL